MRVLIALDLNDHDLAEAFIEVGGVVDKDDVREALEARLGQAGEACYCGPADMPVRGEVLAVADVTRTLPTFLSAAEVGAEGLADSWADEDNDDEVAVANATWNVVRDLTETIYPRQA